MSQIHKHTLVPGPSPGKLAAPHNILWPSILWLCFNMKTKADWVILKIHTSLLLIQKVTEDNTPNTKYIGNRAVGTVYKMCFLTETAQGHKGCPYVLPLSAHHGFLPFHFISHSHLSFCLHSTVRSPRAPVVTWHGLSPHFQLRALLLLVSVKPNPP